MADRGRRQGGGANSAKLVEIEITVVASEPQPRPHGFTAIAHILAPFVNLSKWVGWMNRMLQTVLRRFCLHFSLRASWFFLVAEFRNQSGSESFPESVSTPNNSLRTRMNGIHFPLRYAPIAPRFSSTCCFQNPRPSFLIHYIPNSTHHPRKISYSSTMGRGFVIVKAQMTTDEKKISDDRMLVYVPPHPLIKHWVSVLRNEQTPCAIFRSAMGELGRLLMYEASRDWLPIVAGEIQSPMGVASVEFIDPREPVAVVPILRAGLALVEHASSILPAIKTYHLGVSRDEETLQPTIYLNKLPESFPEGSRVFVVDPMLATGGTIVAALDLLKERGVGNKQIKVISAVAAPPALQKLSEKFPGLHVYTGIIDPTVNEKGFIIPGLGDAGDRSFGT